MQRSRDEQFLHDWVIRKLKEKYLKLYKEVHINPGDEKNYELKGKYPDALCVNYGQIVLILEIETENSINEEEVNEWKHLMELGAQLVVLVPKEHQNAARDLCWKSGIASKVKIGFYDVVLHI